MTGEDQIVDALEFLVESIAPAGMLFKPQLFFFLSLSKSKDHFVSLNPSPFLRWREHWYSKA